MISLAPEIEEKMIASIQQYAKEHMDEEIGDLKAAMLLDFFVREIGPSVYNQAILDAQARLQEHVSAIDETCYEPEFGYWQR